ncbi:MAG TPA: Fe-S cluster assembly ATPase SufC [Bacteroidota bacterium]|nr:Fe-S cluster assembly ATPase SufC [Bacteroidota bacterium]
MSVDSKTIVNGISLEIKPGEVHAIMGPNGSGKSTLAATLMGHPKYTMTNGTIDIDGTAVNDLKPNERATLGLFLSMQYPPEIAGVTIANFLRTAFNNLKGTKVNPIEFQTMLLNKMKELDIDPAFARRAIHVGFSGGEKKRAEILQLAVLDPKYAILDETDSGLDIDALKVVANGINRFRGSKKGVVLITHYNRILEFVKPDYVHIMKEGKIVKSGGAELAKEVERSGYEKY